MEQHNRVKLWESLAVCYFWWGEWKRSLKMMLEHLDGLEGIAHEINVESTMQRLFNPNKTAEKLNFIWISYQALLFNPDNDLSGLREKLEKRLNQLSKLPRNGLFSRIKFIKKHNLFQRHPSIAVRVIEMDFHYNEPIL